MNRKRAQGNDPSRLIACQEALAHFGRFALQSNSLDDILTEACERVTRGLNVPAAKVAMVQPDGDAMLLKAAIGISESAGIPGSTTVPGGTGSAMGYALLTRRPVISTVDTETRFEPSEVVRKSGVRSSANVVIWAGEKAFGALEADSPEPDVFDDQDAHFLQLYANLLGAAIERQRLVCRADDLARERELLLKESVHRVKNILSVVQAIARRTRKDADSIGEFIQVFDGRISALSRLQDLETGNEERFVRLADLARAELQVSGASEDRHFSLNGPDFNCSSKIARALGLVLHELTTNAIKYGALHPEAPSGSRIELNWRVRQSQRGAELVVDWKERGGAPKKTTRSGGFGSELLRNGIAYIAEGSTDLAVHAEGVDCRIQLFQNELI